MIKTDDKMRCSGCQTCSLVCPKKCITYQKDLLGHFYPAIDKEACINCGCCESVCPIQRTFDEPKIGIEAWVAYSSNSDIRVHGSSGGMFETIARWIVSAEGSVFACKLDEHLQLKCFEAKTYDEVREQTKSKYLQSECSDMFPIIRERVKSGYPVLFCATPCQVAALKLYLGNLTEFDNLYLLDFFCHGVPSQDFFDKCIDYVERHKGIKVTGYEFRSKIPKGATPHYYTLSWVKDGKRYEKTDLYLEDPFYLGFQKYITLRDSCYHCPYGKGNHAADITIGDFHDVDKYIQGINRFDGVSTVLINTEKGKKLWELIQGKLYAQPIDITRLHQDKQIYAGGTKEPNPRAEFTDDLENLDFDSVVNKWFNSKQELKKKLYYRLPAFIRIKIKRIVGL